MSISFRRLAQMMFAAILLLGGLFILVITLYSGSTIHRRVLDSYESSIRLYGQMLENTLHTTELGLSNMLVTETTTLYSAERRDGSSASMLAAQSLNNLLAGNALFSAKMDGTFFRRADGSRVLCQYSVYSIKDIDALDGALSEALPVNRWFCARVGTHWCLMRVYPYSDSVIGAYVDVDAMLSSLKKSSLVAVEDYCFTDGDGVVFSSSLAGQPLSQDYRLPEGRVQLGGDTYSSVRVPVGNTGLTLSALVREEVLSAPLRKNYRYGLLFGAIFVIGALFLYYAVRLQIIRPFQTLADTMSAFREGDVNARMRKRSRVREIDHTFTAYNSMAEQVVALRIANYESELERNRAELQFYQLQIQPHFLINTLNTIYTMAQVRSFDLIQELTMFLVKYYRYTIKAEGVFVRLRDELEHVRSFLGIHEMRLGDRLEVLYDIDDALLDSAIPPIVLQTFVENSVEYAVSMEHTTMIGIEVHVDRDDENMLRITISDTGDGFPQDCLVETPIEKGGRIHIGIHNVRERLRIAYGGKARLTLANTRPHGARVDIVIPKIAYEEAKAMALKEGDAQC
ncbi:MAG: histidine kinase [Clostridia bacterium]|nr:histidine kinase [Clostridia bacterium]